MQKVSGSIWLFHLIPTRSITNPVTLKVAHKRPKNHIRFFIGINIAKLFFIFLTKKVSRSSSTF